MMPMPLAPPFGLYIQRFSGCRRTCAFQASKSSGKRKARGYHAGGKGTPSLAQWTCIASSMPTLVVMGKSDGTRFARPLSASVGPGSIVRRYPSQMKIGGGEAAGWDLAQAQFLALSGGGHEVSNGLRAVGRHVETDSQLRLGRAASPRVLPKAASLQQNAASGGSTCLGTRSNCFSATAFTRAQAPGGSHCDRSSEGYGWSASSDSSAESASGCSCARAAAASLASTGTNRLLPFSATQTQPASGPAPVLLL
eukprot:CAMPEP_0179151150 /NCGR_PEP_ID=MMETSP0796-20121207/73357_1 /TAXON_ID=73915 /ORGANISM="Pyrodinium bahamense, Strain pbaha01" /LENGTH=252 /DNA_ID=CAMNT_0020852203 /DNA_START=159 /DNA_END=917 /DNA_ORIENTATION=+